MLIQVQSSQYPIWIGQDHRAKSHHSFYLKSSTTMMFLVFSVVIITVVTYILCVSFNEAANLLHTKNGAMSPLNSIPMSPQEWISRYIPHTGHHCAAVIGSPYAEVKQHEWLSYPVNNGYPTTHRITKPRKLF